MLKEIITYFANKRMGSVMLNIVDLIWENLDEIEKQMAVSLKQSGRCQLIIQSKLSQPQLEEAVASTPYIAL